MKHYNAFNNFLLLYCVISDNEKNSLAQNMQQCQSENLLKLLKII